MRKIEKVIDQYYDLKNKYGEKLYVVIVQINKQTNEDFAWESLIRQEKQYMLRLKLTDIIFSPKKVKVIEVTEEDLNEENKQYIIAKRIAGKRARLSQKEPYNLYYSILHMIIDNFIGHLDERATLEYLNSANENSGLCFSNEFERLILEIGIAYDVKEDENFDEEEDFNEAEYEYKYLDEYFDSKEVFYEEEYEPYQKIKDDNISRFAYGDMGNYLGFGDKSTGIAHHEKQLAKIAQFLKQHAEILPEFFIKYANIYNFLDENKVLFSWKKHRPHEESEVLMLNLADRTISRVSNSLAKLLTRGVMCIKAGIFQDIFNPEDEVLKIIQKVDGDNVLPSPSAVFEWDKLEDFPDEWKTMLSKKDA